MENEQNSDKNESNYDVVTVEKLVAFYSGELLKRPYEMYRLSTMKGARIYFRELEDNSIRFYMGATSASRYLMTPHLLRWWADSEGYDARKQEMYDKATAGSYFHSLIAQIAKGEEMSVKVIRESYKLYLVANEVTAKLHASFIDTMVKDVLSYLQWCEDYEVKPLAIEMPLCSDTIGVATLVDWVGVINDSKGNLNEDGSIKSKRGRQPKHERIGVHSCIVDFKTGKKGTYETHIMQLQSNKEMFEENFPDIEPIKYYYNLSPKAWRIEPTYDFVNQTDKMNQDRYDALLTLARTDMEGILNRNILTIEGDFKFGTSANSLIRRFTIQEVVNSGEWKEFLPKELPV